MLACTVPVALVPLTHAIRAPWQAGASLSAATQACELGLRATRVAVPHPAEVCTAAVMAEVPVSHQPAKSFGPLGASTASIGLESRAARP